MMTRVVLVVLVLGLIGSATFMSIRGVWGETDTVKSIRNGTLGGTYGVGGRGAK